MRSLSRSGATRFAVVAASLAVAAAVPVAPIPVGLVPVGLGADSSGLRQRMAELRAQESTAVSQVHAAVLTLYALETELSEGRAGIAAVEARRTTLAGERASAESRLEAARTATRVSEARLAELVRALYRQDGADPLALLLGAGSLDEALLGLDGLERAAADNLRVVGEATATRALLVRLTARLAARDVELRRLSEAARARSHALESTIAERATFVDSLRRRQGLTGRRLAKLAARARAAERRTETLRTPRPLSTTSASGAAATSAPPTPAVASGQTLSVSAVGYSLLGLTASGLPVGHGTVAVDPSVIPLGTRLFVPGYGEAVAADTGGAIRGATIDLWFPTVAAAQRWGRRTVAITIR